MFSIGHDVGGFHGPTPGPELFVRFNEFCALWPRMVMNSWNDDGVVNLPWMYPQVVPQVREAIGLRYRLMPYLYTQMWRASRDNEPAVRPLFYDFPDDPAVRSIDDAFMLGPDILVAPVLEEGATQREVSLPSHPGGWYDWHGGQHYLGGGAVSVEAPLGRLPIFVRSGAIIPVGDAERLSPVRELLVFGADADARGELYEDDGETIGWRDGSGLLRTFSTKDGVLSVRSEGQYRPGLETIPVRSMGKPQP
jgi:alpha-glucosidase